MLKVNVDKCIQDASDPSATVNIVRVKDANDPGYVSKRRHLQSQIGGRGNSFGTKRQQRSRRATDDIEIDLPTPDDDAEAASYFSTPGLEHDDSTGSRAWDRIRPALLDKLISSICERENETVIRKEALQSQLQQKIEENCASCSSCGGDHFVEAAPGNKIVKVLWFGHEFRFYLNVPVKVCSSCLQKVTVNPVSIGCFPGSPREAWDVGTTPAGHVPLWFSLGLVADVEEASNELKRFSVLTWAAWFDGIHRRNFCDIFLDPERLRRALADVLLEYGYLADALGDLKRLGADEYPTGLFQECGACWMAGKPCEINGYHQDSRPLHSAFVDGLFKQAHLASQTKLPITQDAELPPNHRFFVPNLENIAFQKAPHNQVARDAAKTCSDFEADAELGRKSKIYDITGIMCVFCRHGYCGLALNMFTGERYSYALLLLYHICIQQQIIILFFWYDINCRYV